VETFSSKEDKGVRVSSYGTDGFSGKSLQFDKPPEKIYRTVRRQSTFVVNVCWSHWSWCCFGNWLQL